jgi:recombination protein RecA
MSAARAEIESLLRARKLDATLTTSAAWRGIDADRIAPTGCPEVDAALGGGVRRGHLSEVIGPRSAGRSAVFVSLAVAAVARGEVVALIDTHDRFDPISAQAAGLDLARLLWIRESGNADRALKAMNLVLQAGGFGVVALDLVDVSAPALRQFPHTTWMRIARVIEGSVTVAVLLASEHVARSPGGVTIALDRSSTHANQTNDEWAGATARDRRLRGLTVRPRIVSARR